MKEERRRDEDEGLSGKIGGGGTTCRSSYRVSRMVETTVPVDYGRTAAGMLQPWPGVLVTP